jgi:hypothetical protein
MRFLTPISPAKAGAQIRPERLELMRPTAVSEARAFLGSIWIPAFAGKVGSGKKGRAA